MPPMPDSARSIIIAQLERHNITFEQFITESGRSGKSAQPHENAIRRWEVMHQLRQLKRTDGKPLMSMERIGLVLGGMDHTTVRYGLIRWAKLHAEAGQKQAEPACGDVSSV